MIDQPARWIEKAEFVALDADPAAWTDDDVRAALALLNLAALGEAVRAALAASETSTQEGE